MDTYQSANMAQSLIADGFKVQILSVDRVDNVGIEQGRPIRVCKPYAFFKTTIYERHIKIYKKCDLLTEEITSLERLSDGHIDHPKSGSKDACDALCGSLYTASQFAEEYSYSYGENLTASLEANLELDDQQLKTKMIQDFQDELLRTYQEVDLSPPFTPQSAIRTPRATIQSEQHLDYQTLMDISAGIIFI